MSSAMSAAGQPQQQDGQQGKGELDQPRDQGPTEREATPETPDPNQSGDPSAEKPGQPKDGQETAQGRDPDSPEPNPLKGENEPGTERPEPTRGEASGAEDSDRWGELPRRFEETFRAQGGRDVPVQYRDWIDAYYRRLAESR
jgi:hypothetical protein